MSESKGEKWLDIGQGWLLRYKFTETWLDFEAFEVVAVSVSPDPGKKFFLKKNWAHGADHVESPDDAEAQLTGYVKWDGCCEMGGPKPHFCGAESVAAYCRVMQECHRLALLIPNADLDCAGYPDIA